MDTCTEQWEALDSHRWGLIVVATHDQRVICQVMKNGQTEDEQLANANLIAAAQDLRDATKELLALVELLSPIEGDTHRKARRALAKAGVDT